MFLKLKFLIFFSIIRTYETDLAAYKTPKDGFGVIVLTGALPTIYDLLSGNLTLNPLNGTNYTITDDRTIDFSCTSQLHLIIYTD